MLTIQNQYLNEFFSSDLAVGAPYEENNSGTVYIFRGHKNGLRTKPSQIIKGKAVGSDILGFGISISRPVDVDHNHYEGCFYKVIVHFVS